MPDTISEKIKLLGKKFSDCPSLRFFVYAFILVLVSLRLSDYGNIDLLHFWQHGHCYMLLLSLFPTALLIHSFCLLPRWLGGFLMGGWLLFIAVQVHVLETLNYRVSFGLIANAFETDIAEASTFITHYSVGILIVCFLFAYIFVWGMGKLKKGAKSSSRLLWGGLLLMTSANALFAPPLHSVRETALWPFQNIVELGKLTSIYWFEERSLMQSLKNLPSTASVESEFSPHPITNELTVFFHFGETARADHWSLNGYERPTTPFAEKEYQQGNLINFPKTLSFAAGTRLSCVGMLTPAKLSNPSPIYGPLFDLYKKHGFSLHAFRSNQKADDQRFDSTLISLTKIFKGATTYEAGTADKLIPAIQAHLNKDTSPHRFLFYYGEGSHIPYLYSDKSAKFLPDDMDPLHPGNSPQEFINRYDNSILATDQFIQGVIESLRDKIAIYVYASDHGEYLGEHGNYTHGSNFMCHKETRYIPFFIWLSPKFQETYPLATALLKGNAKNLPLVSHDYLFHTTLSLSQIKSPIIEEKLDLSSLKVKPHKGIPIEEIPADFTFDSLNQKVPN